MSRKLNEREFADLWSKAEGAGYAAANAATPTPMLVGSAKHVFGNEMDTTKPMYVVPDGPCGFAWVVVRPGNSRFANWAKKFKGATAEYHGGVCVRWVREFNQSITRKEAFAYAFADVLKAAGLTAYGNSRLD